MKESTDQAKIKQRIKDLRKMVDYHRQRYHQEDNPEISDQAYDALFAELEKLEEENPEFNTQSSPTQQVGGAILKKFEKVRHEVAQWSFDDCFNFEELQKWDEKVQRKMTEFPELLTEQVEYCCELKIDGLKVILTYDHGKLQLGATRGDGSVGEKITNNLLTVKDIPQQLKQKVSGIFVGECWIGQDELKRINQAQAKKGEAVYANTRNLAAGSLRQLDSSITAKRKLNTFIYDIDKLDGQMPDTQSGEIELIDQLGFNHNPHFKVCASLTEVEKFYQHWNGARQKLNYGLDGIVIKINSRLIQEKLGYTAKSPRWGIAYKFPAEQTTTIVEDIILQVGRTGVITPVAKVRPTLLAGSTISRATLHNEDEIKRLDLRVGDTVILEKAGDVIPKIVRVLAELRPAHTKAWQMPKRCLLCGGNGEIERIEGQSAWKCKYNSFEQDKRKWYYFVSKKAFDVVGCGPRVVDQLLEAGLVNSFADLFDLQKGDILELEGFKEKSADNLLQAIKNARQVSLPRFLIALSIDGLGEETAYLLANYFGSLNKIQAAAQAVNGAEKMMQIYGVGEILAADMVKWFANEQNLSLLTKLLKKVVIEPYVASGANSLTNPQNHNLAVSGKVFVLTGTLPNLAREAAEQKIRLAGGKISSSVSTKTDYLLAGDKAGSKLTRARQLKIKIIDEVEFLTFF